MEPGSASATDLLGRVAVVAGGTRGAGRGIAVALGARGATVYVTGRSSSASGPSELGRSETIEGTAQLVDAAGGHGIAVRCDHMRIAEVDALRARIESESGRLDVLVNDIWGGEALIGWGVPFWEHDLEAGLRAWRNAVETHLITSHRLVPLLVANGSGLVIEVTDGDSERYRGSLFYDLAKASAIRLALAQSSELAPHGVAAVSLTPGFLRSEEMLDHFGVQESNWRDGIAKDPHFALAESPAYVGRAVAALAADPGVMRWSGQALSSWVLAREYGFRDVDGSQPDWGRWFDDVVLGELDPPAWTSRSTADRAGAASDFRSRGRSRGRRLAERLEGLGVDLEGAAASAAGFDLRVAELEALAAQAAVVLQHRAGEQRGRERVDHDRETRQVEHEIVVAPLVVLEQVLEARAAAALHADAQNRVRRAAFGLAQGDCLDACLFADGDDVHLSQSNGAGPPFHSLPRVAPCRLLSSRHRGGGRDDRDRFGGRAGR